MNVKMGRLDKMFFFAYERNEPNAVRVAVDGEDRFVLQVNPESYTQRYGVEYADNPIPGSTGDPGTYDHTLPKTFDLDILFDSSGVIQDQGLLKVGLVSPLPLEGPDDVTARIEKLKKFCYNFQSDTHRPYFVRLCWGDESGFFFGVVKTLSIDFKLFKPNGKPIRAVAHLSLQEARSPQQQQVSTPAHSPDLTHHRIKKAGDVFTQMVNRQYDSPDYYLDVARANSMVNFRNIRSGTTISFPPLK